ncbi:hypothetical protein BDP55DRAFT_668907 [Colletotrichum godetiae]|uniref:Uncharacterized protein n=1 Tax=Colletotrichum godetiae TaxID=1209918 RepID=A0AAJ0EU72_9PEZI|nr:uncharacterized protein BDP55DRAFT_668907 [Colletotrichum godetiae]KAK1674048.1 hypothetical protein BDP55DRAFT_668907 [Colletotrichum godetiae]
MPGLTTQTLVQSEKQEKPLVVWQSLKKCLPPAGNKDIEFWWSLTGYHLAVMIDAAGYTTQLLLLLLLYLTPWRPG